MLKKSILIATLAGLMTMGTAAVWAEGQKWTPNSSQTVDKHLLTQQQRDAKFCQQHPNRCVDGKPQWRNTSKVPEKRDPHFCQEHPERCRMEMVQRPPNVDRHGPAVDERERLCKMHPERCQQPGALRLDEPRPRSPQR